MSIVRKLLIQTKAVYTNITNQFDICNKFRYSVKNVLKKLSDEVRNGMGPISQDLASYFTSKRNKVATRCTAPVRRQGGNMLELARIKPLGMGLYS